MRYLTVTATRTRMLGFDQPHCAYDVEVPVSQLTPSQAADCCYFISRGSERFALLYEAFLPENFSSLKPGSKERSEAMREAERKAKAARLLALHGAFPETRGSQVRDLWQPAPASAKDAAVEIQIDAEAL